MKQDLKIPFFFLFLSSSTLRYVSASARFIMYVVHFGYLFFEILILTTYYNSHFQSSNSKPLTSSFAPSLPPSLSPSLPPFGGYVIETKKETEEGKKERGRKKGERERGEGGLISFTVGDVFFFILT